MYMQNLSVTDILSKIHKVFKPKSYLEISDSPMGCRFLDLTDPEINVVGVNYWPKWDLKSLPKNAIIYPVTSDYFFQCPYMTRNNYKADMIVVDGCKRFELMLRNCTFSSHLVNEDGLILITGTSPEKAEDAIRPRFGDDDQSKYGDGYKFLSILKKNNITAHQILCDDGGLTVISGNNLKIFTDDIVWQVRDFLNLPFEEREKSYDISPEEYLEKFLKPRETKEENIS